MTAPLSIAKQQKASQRTTPKMKLTKWPAGGWRLAWVTTVLLGAPIEKVNAPCTGCESAEMTCQLTV